MSRALMTTTRTRLRWAAAGAAAVSALAAGSLFVARAAENPPDTSSFVPIVPCRLIDTRPSFQVGTRGTPLGADSAYTATVWGENGDCTIPRSASGVSLNVTAISPTKPSFLTVYPADATRPTASNLNYFAGKPPTPNAVTVKLSADGKIKLYNFDGTVDVVVDIVGYYHGNQPYTVVTVGTDGGQFNSISDALASISDAAADNRYVIQVAPGAFVETDTLAMKNYVDIEGAGEALTSITCACGDLTETAESAVVAFAGPNMHSQLRNLTVTNTGTTVHTSIGVYVGGVPEGEASISNVKVAASGAVTGGGDAAAFGVFVTNSTIDLDHLTVTAHCSCERAYGLYNVASTTLVAWSSFTATDSTFVTTGIHSSASSFTGVHVSATALSADSTSTGIVHTNSSTGDLRWVTAHGASNTADGRGLADVDSSVVVTDSQVTADGYGTNAGLFSSDSTERFTRVTIVGLGTGHAIANSGSTIHVAYSSLLGGTATITGDSVTCAFTVNDATFAAEVCS